MRYGIMEQQAVNSPLTGRDLGVRHRGGGSVENGKKGAGPTDGFLKMPNSTRLMVDGATPNPGGLTPGSAPGQGKK